MTIRYRPAAISDMEHTSNYLADTLGNPTAAQALRERLLRSISLLRDNPRMGTPLTSKYEGLDTQIRYLVVSKQLVFYEVHEAWIEIVRVLDGRTDYLSHLFEDL